MRYSEILKKYYNIRLTDDHCDLLDTYFTGSSHHLWRFRESTSEKDRMFHLSRHRLHLRLMMTLVLKFGDFSVAVDPTNKGLNRREGWDCLKRVIPDYRMFESMKPDETCRVGEPHLSDHYLYDPDTLVEFEQPSRKTQLC